MRNSLHLLALFVVYSTATTLLVPSQYATIQAAINAAQTGDVIQISGGTYQEKLVFGPTYNADGVTIVAENDTIVTNGALWAFSRQISGLTFRNLKFVGPVTGQNWMFDYNSTTFGVSNFVLDSCWINGNSGSQLGLRFNYFDGNLTILNSDFTRVGWGIIETGTGAAYESPGIFDQILIQGNKFHECYGALNLRGNLNTPTNAVTLQNNSWVQISNDYSDTPWPLKGFEAYHARSVNLLDNYINNITKGVVGHGGAIKGMICEMWDVATLVIANNNFQNCYQGIALRSGPVTPSIAATQYSCPSVRANKNAFLELEEYAVNTNGPIDLSFNYWGDSSGPESDQITGPGSDVVLTFPWYVSGPGGAVAQECNTSCIHGSCDYDFGTCTCDDGYSGVSCETAPQQKSSSGKKGFPAWAAVLIALLIVFVIIAVVIAVLLIRRRRNNENRALFSKNYGT